VAIPIQFFSLCIPSWVGEGCVSNLSVTNSVPNIVLFVIIQINVTDAIKMMKWQNNEVGLSAHINIYRQVLKNELILIYFTTSYMYLFIHEFTHVINTRNHVAPNNVSHCGALCASFTSPACRSRWNIKLHLILKQGLNVIFLQNFKTRYKKDESSCKVE
jgi:hypothetical protein